MRMLFKWKFMWKFMNKDRSNIEGIFFSRIKNIFVNPDLGREGIHSMKKATLNSPQVKIIKKSIIKKYQFIFIIRGCLENTWFVLIMQSKIQPSECRTDFL